MSASTLKTYEEHFVWHLHNLSGLLSRRLNLSSRQEVVQLRLKFVLKFFSTRYNKDKYYTLETYAGVRARTNKLDHSTRKPAQVLCSNYTIQELTKIRETGFAHGGGAYAFVPPRRNLIDDCLLEAEQVLLPSGVPQHLHRL